MELFGILFSIPVIFIASSVYAAILLVVIRHLRPLSEWMWWTSVVVLAWFVIELVLLLILGAVRSRDLLGPAYSVAHMILFFLGIPALANLIILRQKKATLLWWGLAVVARTCFGLVLVLMQYEVSESLYGIDGNAGPYSGRIEMIP